MRNFEGKLRNHAKLAKLGFFVALNGFTQGVEDHLKRVGRDDLHIVLLQRRDIEEYLNTHLDFYTWLETRAAVFY